MAEAGPRTVEGLRWSCTGCAACCKAGYGLGPLRDETVDGLEAAGIGALWPAAAEGWYDVQEGPDGQSARYLRTREDGACVFLREDELCGIHALLGAAAKPWFCRRFPMAPVRDPEGWTVVVRPTCHGHHTTFEEGPEVDAQTLQRAVDQTDPSRRSAFEPEVVEVLPRRGVGLDDWMYLEGRMLAALDDPEATPWDGMRALRDVLSGALKGGWPAPERARSEAASQAVLQAFRQVLFAAASSDGGSRPHRRRVVAALGAVDRALEHPAGEPELDPAARRWLHLNLRSAILGKEIHGSGPVVAGLGLHLVSVDLFARAAGARPARTEDFGVDWSLWHDLLANRAMRAAVHVVRPALVDRLVHL